MHPRIDLGQPFRAQSIWPSWRQEPFVKGMPLSRHIAQSCKDLGLDHVKIGGGRGHRKAKIARVMAPTMGDARAFSAQSQSLDRKVDLLANMVPAGCRS